jgi:transcriptional regulator with XRE-family HTH domain
MIVNDARRVRVIRAMLEMGSKEFADAIGIGASTLWSWESGRSAPNPEKRDRLQSFCRENGIALSPGGYPFPASELAILYRVTGLTEAK